MAGASFAARLARAGGGFHAETTEPLMIGQIQVLDLADAPAAAAKVLAQKQKLIDLANRTDPIVVSLHGGARDVEVRVLPESPVGPMLVVHLIYDCRDAMGANMVNTACEALAPLVEEITGGRVNLRILSNLADRRLARARCVIPASALDHRRLPGRAGGAAHRRGLRVRRRRSVPRRDAQQGHHERRGRRGDGHRQRLAGDRGRRARLRGPRRRLPLAFNLVGGPRRPGRGPRDGAGRQRGAAAGGRHRRRRDAGPSAGAPGAATSWASPPRASWPRSSPRSAWRRTWRPSGRWRPRASSAATWRCTPGRSPSPPARAPTRWTASPPPSSPSGRSAPTGRRSCWQRCGLDRSPGLDASS